MTVWIVAATVIVFLLALAASLDQLPKVYRGRHCTGSEWHRQFPDAPKAEIRRFLELFAVHAFGFRKRYTLKFGPQDRVMDVYRAVYRGKLWVGDAMEIESLGLTLGREYGVDLLQAWHPGITLGELFRMTREPPHGSASALPSGP